MSLSRFGEDVARMVAGELSADEERPLREHLRGCEECRARYDALTLAARAVKGGEATATEARRAEEQLLAALDPKPVRAASPRSFIWWALGIPVAVALVMGIVTTLVPPPRSDVEMRGGAEDDAGMFTLQLYAKPKDGAALRLAAEFPGSGEARVSASEWLQVKYLPDRRGSRAFAVDAKGVPTALPSEGSVALAPGSYDLFGLHDLSMTEAQALEDAKVPWPPGVLPVKVSERAHVVQGRIQVDP
jgi:hypothetical protein